MNKPMNFDNVSTGEFTPINVGGHKMIIRKVEETKTKADGRDMLVVYFDFDQGDSQPNYFMQQFQNDIRPDKKWPNAGISYVVATDNTGMTSKNFKTFIKSVEDSNTGFSVNWCDGPAFVAQFANKKVGGVFGRVEDEYNGERKLRTKLRWFCSAQKADSAKAPEDKLLPAPAAAAAPSYPTYTPVNDESMPF